MLTSITLTSTGSAVSTSTPKTGKLVRAYVAGGDSSVAVVITADAGNNLPATTIYTATANLATGVEITLPSVVYYAEQTFTMTVAEAATAVLIIDTDG